MQWKITPEWKKSIIDRHFWKKDGVKGIIEQEIGWRWGEFYVTPPEGVTIEQFLEDYDGELNIFEEFEDVGHFETSDGCWEEWSFYGFDDEEEQERLEELVNGEGSYELEETEGWSISDTETIIQGDISIEEVDD
jgi:hypothetical protein